MAGLVIVVVVAAGLGAMQTWPRIPWWAVIAAAALAAVVAGIGSLWQGWREHSATAAGTIRRSVRGARGAADDRLPTVAEVALHTLGVHHAVIDVPYVARGAKEHQVGEQLRAGRPVLLVGSSMVGKTRLAATVVKRLYPERPILIPEPPAGLANLDKADMIPRGHVIWLDDLDRFLGGGELTAGLIQRLASSNSVIATLRAKEWDRFQPTDQLRPPQWEVLSGFELATLDRDRDRPTEEDLERAIPDAEVRKRIAQIGIGEYVGAAQHIKDQLELGVQTNPLGFALVLAAVDWRRTGITRPVPAALLPRLAAARLSPRHRAELADSSTYADALRWATRELNPTVSLLQPGDGEYTVYDYALDRLADQGDMIPEDSWHLVIDSAANGGELMEIGFQALALYLKLQVPALLDIAERASRQASDAGDTRAMSNMGVVLQYRGRAAEAVAWTRKAVAAGNTDAIGNLGALLDHYGEVAEAELWLRRAAEAGDIKAMQNLAIHLKENGDLAGAEAWYRRRVEVGDAAAIAHLAVLLERRGEMAEAETWYRGAAEAGDTVAMNRLGLLLQRRGRLDEAETWWRQAAEAGEVQAMSNLGLLQHMRGHVPDAEAWSRKAADAGDAGAMNVLGAILLGQGEAAEAESWWRKAIEAGDTNAVTHLLGLIKAKREIGEDKLRKVTDVQWPLPGDATSQ